MWEATSCFGLYDAHVINTSCYSFIHRFSTSILLNLGVVVKRLQISVIVLLLSVKYYFFGWWGHLFVFNQGVSSAILLWLERLINGVGDVLVALSPQHWLRIVFSRINVNVLLLVDILIGHALCDHERCVDFWNWSHMRTCGLDVTHWTILMLFLLLLLVLLFSGWLIGYYVTISW